MKSVTTTPQSPAEAAGWRVGDVVTAIDGRPVAESDFEQRFDWTFARAGTEVELVDGEGRVRRLELADYPH